MTSLLAKLFEIHRHKVAKLLCLPSLGGGSRILHAHIARIEWCLAAKWVAAQLNIRRVSYHQKQAALLEVMSLLVWRNWTPSAVVSRCILAYHPHSQVVTQRDGCQNLSNSTMRNHRYEAWISRPSATRCTRCAKALQHRTRLVLASELSRYAQRVQLVLRDLFA